MAKYIHAILVALCATATVNNLSAAEAFEKNGTIISVQPETNTIQVEDTNYKLPNNILLENTPAIFQLRPGYQIGFSGRTATPDPIIESVYLYPDSVIRVEQGIQQQ